VNTPNIVLSNHGHGSISSNKRGKYNLRFIKLYILVILYQYGTTKIEMQVILVNPDSLESKKKTRSVQSLLLAESVSHELTKL